jgi:hypothetical protein
LSIKFKREKIFLKSTAFPFTQIPEGGGIDEEGLRLKIIGEKGSFKEISRGIK